MTNVAKRPDPLEDEKSPYVLLAATDSLCKQLATACDSHAKSPFSIHTIPITDVLSDGSIRHAAEPESLTQRQVRQAAMGCFQIARQSVVQAANAVGLAVGTELASGGRPQPALHLVAQTLRETRVITYEGIGGDSSGSIDALPGASLVKSLSDLIAASIGAVLPSGASSAAAPPDRTQSVTAPPEWQDLMVGRLPCIACGRASIAFDVSQASKHAIFPGAFNPFHDAHQTMASLAEEILSRPVCLEMSIENVDKPPLDYLDIQQRIAHFPQEQAAVLTRAATFAKKAALFPGATFVVGLDTIERIGMARYYADDAAAMSRAIETIAEQNCGFLVFGRAAQERFRSLSDAEIPDCLRMLCRAVPESDFRIDVSSTELRGKDA